MLNYVLRRSTTVLLKNKKQQVEKWQKIGLRALFRSGRQWIFWRFSCTQKGMQRWRIHFFTFQFQELNKGWRKKLCFQLFRDQMIYISLLEVRLTCRNYVKFPFWVTDLVVACSLQFSQSFFKINQCFYCLLGSLTSEWIVRKCIIDVMAISYWC